MLPFVSIEIQDCVVNSKGYCLLSVRAHGLQINNPGPEFPVLLAGTINELNVYYKFGIYTSRPSLACQTATS